jgi:hypothetical protein
MIQIEIFEKMGKAEKLREIEYIETLIKYTLRTEKESGILVMKEQRERLEELLTLMYYMYKGNNNGPNKSKRKSKKSK